MTHIPPVCSRAYRPFRRKLAKPTIDATRIRFTKEDDREPIANSLARVLFSIRITKFLRNWPEFGFLNNWEELGERKFFSSSEIIDFRRKFADDPRLLVCFEWQLFSRFFIRFRGKNCPQRRDCTKQSISVDFVAPSQRDPTIWRSSR